MASTGHQRNCPCGPCVSRRSGEANRVAAAELAATRRDVARLQVHDAGGPDALLAKARAMGDPGLAARILSAAGLDVAEITSRWRSDAAPAQQKSGFWSQFPDHDPRFLSGQMSLDSVKAEYDTRRLERQARDDRYHGRDQQPAAMGVSTDERGVPVQRSTIDYGVPPLGSGV